MCCKKMDTSEQVALNADSFLHGPVLINTRMDQQLPLTDLKYGLGTDVPSSSLDAILHNNSDPHFYAEALKKETVINMLLCLGS